MARKKSEQATELPPYQSALVQHPEYATAIGMVSIEIANLEILLGELLAALLHIDPHFGRVIYLTPQSNIARVSIIENVLADTIMKGAPGRKHVEKLLEKAKEVIGKRHQLIHNAWGLSPEKPTQVIRQSLPYKEGITPKEVSITELNDLISAIRKLSTTVKDTTEATFKVWPPYTWQQKQVGPPPQNGPPSSSQAQRRSRKGKDVQT